MAIARSFATSLLIAALCACSRGAQHSRDPDASWEAAIHDAGVEASKIELIVSARAHLLDGGSELIEEQRSVRARIEPTQQITVSTNVVLRNHRIRVFDEADRAMISDDHEERSDQGTNYEISFHEPLKPGHRYTLVLDAQTGATAEDSTGQALPEKRIEFQVTGEREKEKRPSRKNPVKRRRRR